MTFHYKFCALSVCLAAGVFAADSIPTHVPAANTKVPGQAAPNILSPELLETAVAQGSSILENPSGVFKYYGYNDNGPMVPTDGTGVEANKTEPDKNVYLVLNNQHGGDPDYNYGTHFLFQGHESSLEGATDPSSYITRINLDADGAHRVTLMATDDNLGGPLPNFDGITWYPFSQQLLLTAEGSGGGGVWQATLGVPSTVVKLTGIMGQGGYEGIQADEQGRIIIVEDSGGSKGESIYTHSRRPNSFVYRFLPYNTSDLTAGGVLQALQLTSLQDGTPIEFGDYGTADDANHSADVLDMHTYGKVFEAKWVKVHDTATDGTAPFNANAAAKASGATPFKRPENGQFRPGSHFSEFYFDETGDTDNRSEVGAAYGAFGAIFRIDLLGGENAKVSLVYNSPDQVHAGFDNCAFWDAGHIVFAEDAGDTLHTQRNALDSAWLFDLNANYASGAQPVRIFAEGRDASATLDSIIGGGLDFTNDGDNEITGWHLSDGDPTVLGLLGAKIPKPFTAGWRLFYTQQHGDNTTFEILSRDSIKAGK